MGRQRRTREPSDQIDSVYLHELNTLELDSAMHIRSTTHLDSAYLRELRYANFRRSLLSCK